MSRERGLPPAEEFPVNALSDVMAAGVRALHAKTQAPYGICGNSMVASATLAAQAHRNVKLPTGEEKPISNYYISVAKTGERKSSVDSAANVPVKERQTEMRVYFESEIRTYLNAKDAYASERNKILIAELLLDHYPEERDAAIEHLDFAIAEMQPALERAQSSSLPESYSAHPWSRT